MNRTWLLLDVPNGLENCVLHDHNTSPNCSSCIIGIIRIYKKKYDLIQRFSKESYLHLTQEKK